MLFALFGISNDALNLAVNLILLSLVVVYFALIAWTFFDARRRIKDPVLVASSVGASFVFPFIGTVIYSILRPPEFLEDAHEREVEIKAAELRVRQLTEQACPKCEYPVEKSFLRCPNCRARLKDPCTSCGKPVDPRWALCPYCETPIEKPERERRAARRAAKPEAKPARRAAKPGREGRPGREPRPAREPRRPAAAGAASKQSKRPAEAQRSKASASGARRSTPRKAAEKQAEREDKQEAGSPASGGSTGEERPRPATAS